MWGSRGKGEVGVWEGGSEGKREEVRVGEMKIR